MLMIRGRGRIDFMELAEFNYLGAATLTATASEMVLLVASARLPFLFRTGPWTHFGWCWHQLPYRESLILSRAAIQD